MEIQGLKTIIYPVGDMAKAQEWYEKAFQVKPYFTADCYVGFFIGNYEIGIEPLDQKKSIELSQKVYWQVKELRNILEHFVTLGAQIKDEPMDIGEGIFMASVLDPWGNFLGFVEHP
jgi:predicted enzyme related to lactoylglutathione lyase